MPRARLSFAVVALVVAVAGCGGSKNESTTTTRTAISHEAELAYEHAYSECSSIGLKQLATKYDVVASRGPILTAVAAAWADRFQAGDEGVRVARAGCRDGFASRTGST